MPIPHRSYHLAPLIAVLLLANCGGKEESDTSAETAAAEELNPEPEASAPPAAAAPAVNPTYAPLTPEDIARWEKGMDGEMQAIQDVGEKLKSGRTREDTANAIMAVQEMATLDAGAQAAGLERERYQFIRSKLSSMAAYLTPSAGGLDTTILDQSQRDELRQGRQAQIQRMEKDVPPEVVEAMKPRAAELRTKSMELVGARFKAAGIR